MAWCSCAVDWSLYLCACGHCISVLFSLECVKKHKLEDACTGVRCKTSFVSLNSFTDGHLFSGM